MVLVLFCRLLFVFVFFVFCGGGGGVGRSGGGCLFICLRFACFVLFPPFLFSFSFSFFPDRQHHFRLVKLITKSSPDEDKQYIQSKRRDLQRK